MATTKEANHPQSQGTERAQKPETAEESERRINTKPTAEYLQSHHGYGVSSGQRDHTVDCNADDGSCDVADHTCRGTKQQADHFRCTE